MAEAPPETLSLKRRLASGGAWALGGRVLLALTGLATNALLGRLLTPQELGVFFLAFSVVSFCAILSLLGLETTVVRFVAESMGLERPGRARQAVQKIFILGLLATSIVGTAYVLFGGSLVARLVESPILAAISGLIAGWILASTLQSLLAETFRGFHDIRLASLFSRSNTGFGSLMSGILLTAGLAALWIFEGQTDLVTVMFLAVGSGLSSALLAAFLLRARVKKLPSAEDPQSDISFKHVLNVTWPLLVTNVMLLVLTQADIWVVGAFRPQEEVAIYGAAARLVALMVTPLLVVNAVVSPFIPESYARGRTEELERMLRFTATLAGIPAFLTLAGFILLGGPILAIVFGEYYAAGFPILVALSVGHLALVWVGSCGIVLVVTGHQIMMMTITIISGSLAIAAGLVSVQYFGAPGVAVSSAAGAALQSFSMLLAVKYTTGMWTHCDFKNFPELLRSMLEDRRPE